MRFPGKFFAVLALAGLLAGCKKKVDNCALILQVKIVGAKPLYYVGDTISLTTNVYPYALYIWMNSNAPNQISGTSGVFIYPCTKADEGLYTLSVSNPDCTSILDSVTIKVINKPVTPACTPNVNSLSFSALPSYAFGSCNWGLDPVYICRNLSSNPPNGYQDFNVYFNPIWNNQEPEDGAYSISSDITFSQYNPYAVFIASTYESIYFQANPGIVYVTHANGKLQVTLCGITMIGDNGSNSFKSTVTGKLQAP